MTILFPTQAEQKGPKNKATKKSKPRRLLIPAHYPKKEAAHLPKRAVVSPGVDFLMCINFGSDEPACPTRARACGKVHVHYNTAARQLPPFFPPKLSQFHIILPPTNITTRNNDTFFFFLSVAMNVARPSVSPLPLLPPGYTSAELGLVGSGVKVCKLYHSPIRPFPVASKQVSKQVKSGSGPAGLGSFLAPSLFFFWNATKL